MTHPHPEYAWSPRDWPSEYPVQEAGAGEVWCYTDRFSYQPGDTVSVHVSASCPAYDLRVVRDGQRPRTVAERRGLAGVFAPTPADSYLTGCGWPAALTLDIGEDWPSGLYLVIVGCARPDGTRFEREHFFVVRPGPAAARRPMALIVSTSTMMAYNDWGGANQYRGIGDDPRNDIGAPVVSALRPVARGMLRKPAGAPRESNAFTPPPFWQPRYEAYEWARYNGYSRHHADSFWATYERPFAVWAESQGYELDYYTQHDLHENPDVLAGHRVAVIIGHDEYWSWEMRDAIDRFTGRGGNIARFAGNFFWQVRIEDDGHTQVCYRDPEQDPVYGTDRERLITTCWDHQAIGRPAAATMGLTGAAGVYARYGNAAPRSSGGFTVYRPGHWVFDGTDLYYGDLLGGAPVCIAAFELDGVDYTFRHGLPYPAFTDGAPENLDILAMTPAVAGEEDRWAGAVPLGSGGTSETSGILAQTTRGQAAETDDWWHYGSGMMAVFDTDGGGTVFNAGTTEWVNGLTQHDYYVETITRNVLDRLGKDR